ncbi:hypothetical protein J2X31_001344 [Flavobacterium arsenatis]|uniref:C1q domain-containing protein n=1 Tax=Flavobacterium arsenatis TaxID=1484332 RepID=A0ABU1TMZ5_9FLAO|nr:hypothetical protein [Flavobacterium arsenatis]MDR6967337.1 hypothetical protein [Flavobacterium arsenatis]
MISVLVATSCLKGYAQTGVGTRNPQGALHIDGAKDNPATGAPNATQVANDVIINATTGFMGVGVLAPVVPLDMRSSGGQNAIGLGSTTTTITAVAAEAGAVRYNVSDVPVGPKIEVSDGVAWNKVYLAPQKAVVVARKITTQTIAYNAATPAVVANWQEVRDMSNSFTPLSGEFTAPRNGTYTFLMTFNFVNHVLKDMSHVEVQFYRTNNTPTVLARSYKTFGQSMTGTSNDANLTRESQAGGSAIITLTLTAGDIVVPRLFQNISNANASINLRVTTNAADPANESAGFNNLTIIEH